MADVENILAHYAEDLTDYCSISGTREAVDFSTAAMRCVVSAYQAAEIAGEILQGDQRVILYAPDWSEQMDGHPQKGDIISIGDDQIGTVWVVDRNTRTADRVLIAYELTMRGA